MKYKTLWLLLGLMGTVWAADVPVYEVQPFPEVPLPITRSRWNYYRYIRFRGDRLLILDQAKNLTSTDITLFKNGRPVLDLHQPGAVQGNLCETGLVLTSDTQLVHMDDNGRTIHRRSLKPAAGTVLFVVCSKNGVFISHFKDHNVTFAFYPWNGSPRSFETIPPSVCWSRAIVCEFEGFPDFDDIAFLFVRSQGYILDARVTPPVVVPLDKIFMEYPAIFRMWPIVWEGKKAFLIESARTRVRRLPEDVRRSSRVPIPAHGMFLQDAGAIVVDLKGHVLGRIRRTRDFSPLDLKTSNTTGTALYVLIEPTILPQNPNYRLRRFNVIPPQFSQSR